MKVHNLVVTGSLTSGGENITSISSSVSTTVTDLSSSLSSSIGGLSSSMVTMVTNMSSSISSSIGSVSSSMVTMVTDMSSSFDTRIDSLESTTSSLNTFTSSATSRLNSIESVTGSYATTGSNLFVGNQTISGSIIPAVNAAYDLGSPTHEFRDLYLSSASLYIDGTKVLGSTTQELQITTDSGQSFKILEAGSDTITLQSADGNITLATSGGGDVILDPTTGIIALKGTTTIYAGNRVLSSDGNAIQFGNSVTMTGSLIVTGYIETQELRTTYISSSILYRSGSTKFGDEISDTHAFTGSLLVSGSISIPESGLVSGSSQITYSGLSGVPSGLVSGSSQITYSGLSGVPSGIISGSSQLPSGIVSGSSQLPSGIVSGSVQIDVMSTTNIARLATTGSNTFTGTIKTTGLSIGVNPTANILDIRGENNTFDGTIVLGARGTIQHRDGGNTILSIANDYNSDSAKFEIRMKGNTTSDAKFTLLGSGDATFTGTGTFSGGGNTLTLKKGTGSPAIAFAGTSNEATGLIEGVSGGGVKIYTSTGTISSPSWSSKLLITPSDGVKFGANAISIIGTEGSHGFHYLYSAGNPKIYLEANGVSAFLNPNGVGINTSSPGARLEVKANDSYANGSQGNIKLTNTGYRNDELSSYGEGGYLDFYFENYTDAYGGTVYDRVLDIVVKGSPDGTYGKGVIRFKANPKTASSNSTEIMRIQGDNKVIVNGNLGVNDTNPSKRLTVNYGGTGLDGLYVYGSQRQNTIFRSTGEHCFLYIDSFHQNTYLPVIHFQRSSTTYGSIGLNRASNSDALGSWTESEMYVGTDTNTPISLKVNNERVVIVSSSSMSVKNTILPTSDATYDLGSTSKRWNNLYTTDLHLSNEGKQNIVDGTWGDWTLQEGEHDIYMINNRNGEKFKIKLEKIEI